MIFHTKIPGDPVGDQRPRVTRSGVTFHADKPSRWKSDALAHLGALETPTMLKGPLVLVTLAVLKRPGRLRRKKDPDARVWAATEETGSKPDEDNCLKLVQDTLVQAGLLSDDTFVVSGTCLKVYQGIRTEDEAPHVEILIDRMEEQPSRSLVTDLAQEQLDLDPGGRLVDPDWTAECDGCGRKSCAHAPGDECKMTQPFGGVCSGTFR